MVNCRKFVGEREIVFLVTSPRRSWGFPDTVGQPAVESESITIYFVGRAGKTGGKGFSLNLGGNTKTHCIYRYSKSASPGSKPRKKEEELLFLRIGVPVTI